MVHRLAAFLIVIFWFVMTLLLVRNEVSPEASRLREVPIAHVLKILYQHEQSSDLNIYNGASPVGSLRLHPRLEKASGLRALDFSGELRLNLSPEQKTRFNWLGELEMTPDYQIQSSKWTVTLLDPGYLRAEIDTPAGSKTAHFTLRTRERVINQGDLPLDQSGLTGMANQLGFGKDLSGFIQQGRQQSPLVIRARLSSLRYHGEKTDVYLVTVERDGQMLIEANFSQLGQVLFARTLIGYTLRPDDLIP
jgi:hypothetical protein